jgi:hypothetical protein
MLLDPALLVATRQHDLLEEAARDHIADMLPQSHSSMRHELASACLRLANWLDGAGEQVGEDGYVRESDSGPSDWAAGSASA